MQTHKLVISLDTPQNQAHALGCHELHPLSLVLWIAGREIQRPVDSGRLCVSIIHDVINVTYT